MRSVADAGRKSELLRRADLLTDTLRLGADLLVAAALHPEKNQREPLAKRWRDEYSVLLESLRVVNAGQMTPEGARPTYEALDRLRADAAALLGEHQTFHWPLEFPEVFSLPRLRGESPGFAAMVGNPPFLGGQKLTGAYGTPYRDYLVEQIAGGRRGSADLVAYFFLRCGSLLQHFGGMGLLATNTIAQGDTREVGLEQLTNQGFAIVRAVPSGVWPGQAGLEVAHVWLRRGEWKGNSYIDDLPVSGISAMLTVPGTSNGNPITIFANLETGYQGSIVLGKGFVLDVDDAVSLLSRNPHNYEVLSPYLSGDDINSRPDQSPSRWVINFNDFSVEQARSYAECFEIVSKRVYPERQRDKRKAYRDKWWQFAERRRALYASLVNVPRVLVACRVTKYVAHSFAPTGLIYDVGVNVFVKDVDYLAGLLQSSHYEAWVRKYASTLESRVRYTLGDCFETFPQAPKSDAIISLGRSIQNCWADTMLERGEGLTTTANRFHNSRLVDADLIELRRLQLTLGQEVALAYGWGDIELAHGFHETKQGLRFTISEAARREILDRLLELNHQRHAEEVAQGLVDEKGKVLTKKRSGAKPASARRKGAPAALQPSLGLT